ncbi:MAG: class I SAM-dependent methyltransferase [Armatimonadota bacterium]
MQVPETERAQCLWLAERAVEVLRSVPVRAGDVVLDFGCGAGTYALPAAGLVGEGGAVYALDCDAQRLTPVRAAAAASDVLQTILGDGSTTIPLADVCCDVALVYDVLQKLEDREGLLGELHRVLRPSGILSIYPMHLDPAQVRAMVEAADFRFRDDYAGLVLHFIRE